MVQPTTVCPDAGHWRVWLDQVVDGHASELAEHLAVCLVCQTTVAGLRQDADLVATATGKLAPGAPLSQAEVAMARERFERRRASATEPRSEGRRQSFDRLRMSGSFDRLRRSVERLRMSRTAGSGPPTPWTELVSGAVHRWRYAAGGMAAVVALGLLVGFTPVGQVVAAQFLAQFRSQRFSVVAISGERGQLAPFEQLERLGTVESPSSKSMETVASVPEASKRVGFTVKEPDVSTLPAGLGKTPAIRVTPAGEVRFTFDRAKAGAYFQSIGRPDVSLPDKFHGAALVANVPAAALLSYSDGDSGMQLLIGQSSELTAGVDGKVTLDELREFLLGLPGLPPETVRQLRAINDWPNTLPIPVPVDQIHWRETTIAGGKGLVFSDGSGLGSAAVWQRDGRMYGVAGTFKAADIQRVADSLR